MSTLPERYRELWLADLSAVARPAPMSLPALPPHIWFAPPRPPLPLTLHELYDVGIRCGHGETRARLEATLGEFEAQLAQERRARHETDCALTVARAELDQVRHLFDRHERDLQADVSAARARIGELEASTFWRMTWPLRIVLHQIKRATRVVRGMPAVLRRLAPRLSTAREIAKDQGVAELARRMARKLGPRAAPPALYSRHVLQQSLRPLHVPSSDTPTVSVIVPTYGQDLHTFSCLVAVAAQAAQVPLEVIVADDCAPVPAADALHQVSGVRFERGEFNVGFLRNCNRAAALARGEYLLFLNNDAVMAPGTLRALLDIFARFPDAGAAGTKLVYPDGRLQEAGGIVWRDGTAWNWGRGEDPAKPEYDYVRVVDYCSAACLLLRRTLFERLGRFDERYAPAYYEDADLCFKVREASLRVYYQPAAEVVHFEGVSHGNDTGHGTKRHQVENQARFRERWSSRLASHSVNGARPRLEADRDARRRVLFVEACMLTPDQDSGSLRTWRLLRIMREMGCKVTFVAANLERRDPYVAELRQAGIEVLHAPFVRSLDELLLERGGEFDIVVLARYYVAAAHIEAVRRYAPRALLVFDTIDLHFVRGRRLAQLERDASHTRSAEAMHREEIDCVRRCDVTWVVSDTEREILRTEVPRARVLVQSNIHQPVGAVRPFAQRDGLLFVGGFRHPPNVDAVLFLAREIVPRLRERLPGVVTYVVGSNPPPVIRGLEAAGLEIVGYVPDVVPWIERSRFLLSPLRYGAGVKGKVNQAMSHGLPVVATRVSIEGMNLVEGEEVIVEEDAESFVDAVARLYHDEPQWNRLSRAGVRNTERHFSPAVAVKALEELFHLAEAGSR